MKMNADKAADREYEARERAAFLRDLSRTKEQRKEERAEARAEWANALNDAFIIPERVGWLLGGAYGYGSYRAAREAAANRRMNRAAWLAITIAALEWGCREEDARAEFKKLDRERQEYINSMILSEIERMDD
jgi:hypothetical protein